MSSTGRIALRLTATAVLLLSLSMMATGAAARHSAGQARHLASSGFNHIFVIMMENTGNDALLGNPNAPWINSAVRRYNVLGNYYGVTHPSQPNYIAATSGSLNGVNSDNDTNLNVRNVVDQLEAHHLSWRVYMQSLNDCKTGVATATTIAGESGNYKLDHACGNSYYGANLYERKHDPFVSYQDVATSAQRLKHIVDYSQLQKDLDNNRVANYNWISPDQCHDMHGLSAPTTSDICDYSQEQSLISTGDQFLRTTVDAIVASRAWHQRSAIIITWDESDYTGTGFQGYPDDTGCCDSPVGQGGGHILAIVITSRGAGSGGAASEDSFVPSNHYSMLSTVEHAFHLGCLGFTCDRSHVKPFTKLLGSAH